MEGPITSRGIRRRLEKAGKRVRASDYFQVIVNRMKRWQRRAWRRAGYPGRTKRDISALDRFV